MFSFMRRLRSDERGISALEYALLAGSILVVIGGIVTGADFSGSLEGIFGDVNTQLSTAAGNGD